MKHVCLVVMIVIAGCVEQGAGPPPKKIDATYVQSHLLPALPAGVDKLEVAVGDVAIYLGNKVDRPRVAPGQAVTITHYWKVLKPAPSWNVFTLVRGPAGTADFMNLVPTDMQIAHGPAVWEPGEIIEDVQTFTVRPDWRSKDATVTVGMIERGKHGTLDRMEVRGAATRDRAIVARVLEIDLSRAPPPKGTAHLSRAQGPITIDGIGSDTGWLGAAQTELVTAEGGSDPNGKAIVKMTWDDQFLYVFANITENDIVSPFKNQDDPLWKGDCIEIFIDADSNRAGYVELQANPIGVTFDKWFASKRGGPGEDEAWDSNMVVGVKLRGSVERADSGDLGWDVELGIPWAAVKGRSDTMKVELPPRVGDRWRLNVVRVDRKSGGKDNDVAAASWNRITMSDFHALDRMLTVVFADPSGAIVPQPKPTVAPASPMLGTTTVTLVDKPGPNALAVEVLDAGGTKIDNKTVPDGELLAILGGRDPTPELVIRAQSNVQHNRVAALIERAQQAGIGQFALVTGIDFGLVGKTPVPATTPIPYDIVVGGSPFTLIATGAGAIRIGDKALTDADLDRVLAAVAARDRELAITVRPDGPVRQARVLAALERARLAGFTKLSIGVPVISVPAAAEATLATLTGTLELRLNNAEAWFGGATFNDEQVGALLRAAIARDKQMSLVVRGDLGVSHARIVAVVERAKQTGFVKVAVAMATQPGSTPPPVEVEGTPDPKAPVVEVHVPLAGRAVIEGQQISDDNLKAVFSVQVAKDPRVSIVIKADRGVTFARVLAVIDHAKSGGLTRIAIRSK